MSNVAGRLEKETKFYEKLEQKLHGLSPIFKEYYTYKRLQIQIENNKPEPFGLTQITKTYIFGNYAKR